MTALRDLKSALDAMSTLGDVVPIGSFDSTSLEIRIAPTEDLGAAALLLAESGLGLHYDGHDVIVIDRSAQTPTQVVDEEGNPAEGSMEPTSALITPSALDVAQSVGVDVQELLDADVGSGANGRITKPDVVDYIKGRQK